MDWAPVVEPPNSPETRFLTDNPVNLMRSGNFLRMPFSKFEIQIKFEKAIQIFNFN
jgi:hypothetical protein